MIVGYWNIVNMPYAIFPSRKYCFLLYTTLFMVLCWESIQQTLYRDLDGCSSSFKNYLFKREGRRERERVNKLPSDSLFPKFLQQSEFGRALIQEPGAPFRSPCGWSQELEVNIEPRCFSIECNRLFLFVF